MNLTVVCSQQHIDNMLARPEEERDEKELTQNVKPLLTQAEQILNQTQGAIKGAPVRWSAHRSATEGTPARLSARLDAAEEEATAAHWENPDLVGC